MKMVKLILKNDSQFVEVGLLLEKLEQLMIIVKKVKLMLVNDSLLGELTNLKALQIRIQIPITVNVPRRRLSKIWVKSHPQGEMLTRSPIPLGRRLKGLKETSRRRIHLNRTLSYDPLVIPKLWRYAIATSKEASLNRKS